MSRSALSTDRRVTLVFWSITLMGGGLWLLLLNFDLLARFEPTAQYVLAGVLGIIGIGFFGAFLRGREKWWRLIPGWLLLTLAAMVLLSTRNLPGVVSADSPDGRGIAAVLFGGLAVAFLHVFLLQRTRYWWAIIPSGFMFVLGIVVLASIYITRLETLGALLFIGMGSVFVGLYWAARAEQGWWPLIPATVLILFGVVAYTTGSQIQNALLNLWPVLLIVMGVYLGTLALRRPIAPRGLEVNSQGATLRNDTRAPGSLGTAHSTPSARTRSQPSPPARAGATQSDTTQPDTPQSDDAEDASAGVLGVYHGPAPGTSIDVLDDDSDADADPSR